MTYAEYLALPEGSYNLIDGELIVSPTPTRWHQRVQGRLYFALETYVRSHKTGHVYGAPLDVVLRRETPPVVVQPDVMFISNANAGILDRWVMGAPDLVVEVVSPGNARLDMVRKLNVYAQFGVQEYWLVLPELEQVQLLRQTGDGFGPPDLLENDDVLTSALLPGFTLPLPELFAPGD
jgi:Uma2 family endonuclease